MDLTALPTTDSYGTSLATVEQQARKVGKGHGMNALLTTTSLDKSFKKFSYGFRFDPTGLLKAGQLIDDKGSYSDVLKIISKEELI